MLIKITVVILSLISLCLYAEARIDSRLLSKDFYQCNFTKDNSKLPFDSLNCRFVGNWPFGPAYAVAYDNARNLVFLGSGGGVYILNVANPQNPVNLTGQNFRTRGGVSRLFYRSNRLYIADGEVGLEIWDVANPQAPTKLGCYDTPGSAYGVYVLGNYAYVADFEAGLRIINVSNPSSPYEVGFYDTPGWARGVYVIGNYAYVADEGAGLRIINVSNPQSPYEVGFYDTPGWAYGVYVLGNYAYVADEWAGLQIYYGPISGIEERLTLDAGRKTLKIYPNPASLYFVIRGSLSVNKVTIYDVTGKLMKIQEMQGEKVQRISLDGIKNGVYFVKVNDELLEEKLVVTR